MAAIASLDDDAMIAVRRVEGSRLYWYAFRASVVRERASWSSVHVRLREALNLHEYDAAPCVHEPPVGAVAVPVVVVRGSRVEIAVPDVAHTSFRAPDPYSALEFESDHAARGFYAYPALHASECVAPEETFALDVSLTRDRLADASGTAISIPNAPEQFTLTLEVLVAEGFVIEGGPDQALVVWRDDLESASVRVHVTAPARAADEGALLSRVLVVFRHAGTTVGCAERRIAVVPAGTWEGDERGTAWASTAPPGAPLAFGTAADVEVTVVKPDGNPATHDYVISIASSVTGTKSGPHALRLGADPASTAAALFRNLPPLDAGPLLQLQVEGDGARLGALLPDALFATIAATHARTGRTPTLLWQTEEPFLPWELAVVPDAHRIDPSAPPLLGAQVAMGRWALGQQPPAPRPETTVHASRMAVVRGDYGTASGRRRLPHAEAEADALTAKYESVALTATSHDIASLVRATRAGEIVHFACHGQADPTKPEWNGILLQDRVLLRSTVFLRSPLGRDLRPFLFLNACQVGAAGEALAQYAGFAADSLSAGFRGFVGPLWEVRDEVAQQLALELYDAVLGANEPVAEVIRRMRVRYCADPMAAQSTWLAYVYYGHPALKLTIAPKGEAA